VEFYDKSDIGKRRKVNQDLTVTRLNHGNQLLAVVCDGMGGHLAGDLAAKIVINSIVESFNAVEVFKDVKEAIDWIKNTLTQANNKVFKDSLNNLNHRGMGTTVVLSLVLKDTILLTHVGDSRAYLMKDNELKQLTVDHTYVNLLIESGELTKEEAKIHPRKNVLMQALGVYDELEIEISKLNDIGDYLLLCTDGLYNGLEEVDIFDIINRADLSIKEKVDKLIDLTNQYGGFDNIGIVLIDFNKGGK
jgi:Serine/threonine protein phosphatase